MHCGFCTATCPTYVVGRDERDSPRGRIYLIKELLETGRAPDTHDVEPLDHCLSCLSCMTTCPSGVDYRRLIDHARVEVETRYRRDPLDRLLRSVARLVAAASRPLPAGAGPGAGSAGRSRRSSRRLPSVGPRLEADAGARARAAAGARGDRGAGRVQAPGAGAERRRVALLTGCAQAVLAPEINAATIRLLNRAGVDVVLPKGEGCCGSLAHHMGREAPALDGGARQYRRVDARDRRRGPGGDRRHRVRLRRDDQGLRRHARRRSRLRRKGARGSPR